MTKETIGHFINGQNVPDSGRNQDVFNPATGEAVRKVALAAKSTVEEAIAAAEAAFPEWRNTPPIKRNCWSRTRRKWRR
jgi:malonate-semialdehyde dehydrogenase (acetylating)/methylmalonate-semialdehyde dehydrogenase